MGWMYMEPSGDKPALGKASRWGTRVWTERGDGMVPAEPRGYFEWFEMATPVAPIGDQLNQFACEAFLVPGDRVAGGRGVDRRRFTSTTSSSSSGGAVAIR